MELKVMLERLALPLDATEEQALEKIAALKKDAGDCRVWKVRAEENLTKLEQSQKVTKENEELRAENFLAKAKASYRITAAEEVALKKMFMSGPDGMATVKELIDARADNEYLTRAAALQNVKEAPQLSPLAEVNERAAKLVEKDPKLSFGEAQSMVLKSDYELQKKYDAAVAAGTVGGA